MMRKWCKILPYFVVIWMAKKWGERFYIEGIEKTCVAPYPDVIVSLKKV
jgi:hypothetical protein